MPESKSFACRSFADRIIEPADVGKILLVDDDRMMLLVEEKMLLHLGYKVSSHISSTTALEVFERQPQDFDLVITDLLMPDMTGDILSRELIKIRPDIRILVCSGSADALSEIKISKAGIRGIIPKPVQMDNFASTIERVLKE